MLIIIVTAALLFLFLFISANVEHAAYFAELSVLDSEIKMTYPFATKFLRQESGFLCYKLKDKVTKTTLGVITVNALRNFPNLEIVSLELRGCHSDCVLGHSLFDVFLQTKAIKFPGIVASSAKKDNPLIAFMAHHGFTESHENEKTKMYLKN